MPSVERLRTFHEVSRTLHFRRAAEKLGVSQSAVSQQIAALEKEVGAPLFERIGKRVFLTRAGEVLAQHAANVMSALDSAHAAVAALGRGDTGKLRVGASTTPGVYVLPDVLGAFRDRMPRIELELRLGNSQGIERALVVHELDLAIVGGALTHGELFSIDLGLDTIVAVIAPRLAGLRTQIAPRELARWPLLSREPGSASRQTVEHALDRVGVRLSPTLELPSAEMLVRAAASGAGLAFVSRQAAAPAITAGQLVALEVEGLALARPVVAAHHRDKRVTTAMRALVELLRERLARP